MTADDLEDELLLAKHKQLVDLGSTAHPVFAELLEETADPVGVSRLLGMFVEGQGDKRIAKEAIRKLLARPRPSDPRMEIITLVLPALAKVGDSKDATSIVHLLDDPEKNVRLAAIRALGEIGGRDVLLKLDAKKDDKAIKDDTRTQTAIEEARRKIQKRL